MSLHYFLKAGRLESGLSLREAAAYLSVTPSTLYRYEEGLIRRIPESVSSDLLRFYFPYLKQHYDYLTRRSIRLGWRNVELKHPPVTPESLYRYFLAADGRGRQAVLELLRYQGGFVQDEKKSDS